jgi:hypothetical protein
LIRVGVDRLKRGDGRVVSPVPKIEEPRAPAVLAIGEYKGVFRELSRGTYRLLGMGALRAPIGMKILVEAIFESVPRFPRFLEAGKKLPPGVETPLFMSPSWHG